MKGAQADRTGDASGVEPITPSASSWTGREDVLPLKQAAKVLKTTPEALRQRIRRGQIEAQKEGKRWFVHVDLVDRNTKQEADKKADRRQTLAASNDTKVIVELYERLLEEKDARIRMITELSESSRRESTELYKEQVTTLEEERNALQRRLGDLVQKATREVEAQRKRIAELETESAALRQEVEKERRELEELRPWLRRPGADRQVAGSMQVHPGSAEQRNPVAEALDKPRWRWWRRR